MDARPRSRNGGDVDKAVEILRKKVWARSQARRDVWQRRPYRPYIHMAATSFLVEVNCETLRGAHARLPALEKEVAMHMRRQPWCEAGRLPTDTGKRIELSRAVRGPEPPAK